MYEQTESQVTRESNASSTVRSSFAADDTSPPNGIIIVIILLLHYHDHQERRQPKQPKIRQITHRNVRPSGDSRATNRPEHIVQDFPSAGAVRCMRTRAFACDKSLLLLFFGYASFFFHRQFPGGCRICRALSSCVSFANVSGAEPFSLFRYIAWPGCADGFTVPIARCPPDDIGR